MNGRHAVRAIRVAVDAGADAILHVGDFGYTFDRRFMNDVDDALAHHNMVLGFVDGNHEDFYRLRTAALQQGAQGVTYMRPRILHLHRGYRWQWGDISFLALGGAHSVDKPWRTPGKSWWPEEAITFDQANDVILGGPADVMICHDAPTGVTIPGIDGNPYGFPEMEIRAADQHRDLLRAVVDAVQPRHLWHWHYHVRYDDLLHGDGYTTHVHGLAHDGEPMVHNLAFIDLSDLQGKVTA
ncbi:metallophosphoesterase family protein [Prescottella agglutinans]|nr:metallophosphatase [Prescottella agglutinans]